MATNEKRINGRTLNLVPTNPANPASGALCRFGQLVGVAVVTGAGGLATPIDFGPAVYTVSVKGQNGAGNIAVAVGDALYYQDGQAFLDKNQTGYFAGIALAIVTTGSTTAIDVLIGRGSRAGGLVSNATLTSIATQNSTPTAAQLIGGVIEHASVTAAGTATLDTAANIDLALPGAAVGDEFTCEYANTGTQTVTITTAAGLTLKGTAAIATLKNAVLVFRKTGAGAWTVYINLSA